MVSRPIEDIPRIPKMRCHHPVTESSSSSFDSQKREDEAVYLTSSNYKLSTNQDEQQQYNIMGKSLHHHHDNNPYMTTAGRIQVQTYACAGCISCRRRDDLTELQNRGTVCPYRIMSTGVSWLNKTGWKMYPLLINVFKLNIK